MHVEREQGGWVRAEREGERGREMGTKTDRSKWIFSYSGKWKGWLKKKGGGQRRHWAFSVGVMRAFALGRSRACTVDTLRPLSPFFISSLFKARGGNAEVHSRYIQTIQCGCKATCKSAVNNGSLVFWRAIPAQPPCSDTSFICV